MRFARELAKFAWLACAFVVVDDVRPEADQLASSYEVGTFPSNVAYNWTDNVQGVTSDGTWWYITANNDRKRGAYSAARLYRARAQAIDRDLGPSVRPLSHPGLTGCTHVGDLDYRGDAVHVAVDGCADRVARVGVFRRETLAYRGMFELPGLSRAAGVAWNPQDHLLYALNRRLDGLRAYDVRSSQGAFKADFVREIPLLGRGGTRFRGNRVQGLKFSSGGRAYVVFDNVDFRKGGVYAFDVGPSAARLDRFVLIRHGCTGEFTCAKNSPLYLGDELEGLLIEPIASGRYTGDIHVLMIDNGVFEDRVHFRHLRDDEGFGSPVASAAR
jgi:hypothetical protein